MGKRFLTLLIALLLGVSAFPAVSLAADGTISSGGTYELSAYGNDSVITINTTEPVTLVGSPDVTYTNLRIVCSAGSDLTIEHVNIQVSLLQESAISFSGAGNTLRLAGENTLVSGFFAAGIHVPDTAELTIQGSGKLTVTGGEEGAGIGGNHLHPSSGMIRITSGTIIAGGGPEAAGIGGGSFGGDGGNITISNSYVYAYGGDESAGIGGGGYGGDGGIITISDSHVYAYGGYGGAGIGGGSLGGDGGNITIYDSHVYAYGPSAGIGGGTMGAAGNILLDGTGAVFASSDSSDIGAGSGGGGGTLRIGGSVSVLLSKDIPLTPITASHTRYDVSAGNTYGVPIPDTLGYNPTVAYLALATLTYNLNGGTGTLDTVTQARGTDVMLSSGSGLTNGEYSVIGWNTNADGSGEPYAPNSRYTLSKNTMLYAMWGEVTATGVEIAEDTVELNAEEEQTLTASALPEGASGAITWTSSSNEIASVDGDGKVTANKAGIAIIKASVASAFDLCVVFVTQQAEGISVSENELSLAVGQKEMLKAALSPNDVNDAGISWSSSDETVATVDPSGIITGKGAGRAVIRATIGDHSDTCNVVVSHVRLTLKLAVGDTALLGASAQTGDDSDTIWVSSNPSVASVSDAGNVKGERVGSAVITVTAGGAQDAIGITVTAATADNDPNGGSAGGSTSDPVLPELNGSVEKPSTGNSTRRGGNDGGIDEESIEIPSSAVPNTAEPNRLLPWLPYPSDTDPSIALREFFTIHIGGDGVPALLWVGCGLLLFACVAFLFFNRKKAD